MRTREELAWAAGFYDGEGSISISRGGTKNQRIRTPIPKISITQIDPRVLERFRDAVGLGKILGPYSYNCVRIVWFYRVQRFEHVQAIIAMLWPFLGPLKREQIQRVMAQRVRVRQRRSA